jgi:hypothetical protein
MNIEEAKKIVLAKHPDAYAEFLGCQARPAYLTLGKPLPLDQQGWIIRIRANGRSQPLTGDRRTTEEEAWNDAVERILAAEPKPLPASVQSAAQNEIAGAPVANVETLPLDSVCVPFGETPKEVTQPKDVSEKPLESNMSIPRFAINTGSTGEFMNADPNGAYVYFADHQARVRELEQQRDDWAGIAAINAEGRLAAIFTQSEGFEEWAKSNLIIQYGMKVADSEDIFILAKELRDFIKFNPLGSVKATTIVLKADKILAACKASRKALTSKEAK